MSVEEENLEKLNDMSVEEENLEKFTYVVEGRIFLL